MLAWVFLGRYFSWPINGEMCILKPVHKPRETIIWISQLILETSGMSAIVRSAFESIYYRLPCFPVIDVRLVRVRFCLIDARGEHGPELDGFVRPSLMDGVTFPQMVTPLVSFDIEVRPCVQVQTIGY